jgi:hypothetical protein
MLRSVLQKTPGLFLTILLIAFVFGSMITSILNAKKVNDEKKKAIIEKFELPPVPQNKGVTDSDYWNKELGNNTIVHP